MAALSFRYAFMLGGLPGRRVLCRIFLPGLLLTFPNSTIGPCSPPIRTSSPNIVFILVDDLRWHELGCAGHSFIKTSNIDRIAREGAMFRNGFVTTPPAK
jgi:hypothetical protein